MNLQEKLYHNGKEHEEKGKLEGKLEDTLNIIKEFKVSISRAMAITKLPESELQKLIDELKKNNIPYKN